DMLSVRIAELEKRIYEAAGEEFNINSPKQLGAILFEKLGLPHGKKTKSGWSTKADILEKLSGVPVVADVLEYRTYQKLKSTYCDSLGNLVNPATGRIHSVFHQTGTVTGRLSSSDPNMQNIPTRTALGREIRKMFAAKEGCVLVDADYSQIELRVLAHLSKDENMINAFKNGMDIHAVTASQVLGVPIEKLTKEQRSSAKAINFGIIYGMGEYSLSQDLGISFKQAKKYMDDYFTKYRGVHEFMEKTKRDAHNTGYVKTMMNRIRYIPELNSSNANLRSFGERAAMNTPVQGTAADIIKLAMVRVYNRLEAEGLKAKMILQVHDELIIETPLGEIEKVKKLLTTEMENAVQLDVPLIAEAASGKSWYDAK
ncbi:MAG: DNA polymerase, partial [Candidatus Ornithomonoglobus sp.]